MIDIVLSNCGKNYHRTWLYRGIDLTIPIKPNCSYAILGPNGAGKSTFTLMLTGQVSPTEGTLIWKSDGRIIEEHERQDFYSLASPALELPEEFTIDEWFHFHSSLKPFYPGVSVNNIIELCEFPSKIKNKPLMHYSSGMKQRIKLCLSILGNEPISILDEPLTNLDTKGIELYQTLIKEYQSKKCFIVASNREDEYYFCNEKFVIGQNQLVSINQ